MKRLVIAALVVVAVVFGTLFIAIGGRDSDPKDKGSAPTSAAGFALVREDTHYLDKVASGPTLVEFLDFECESCGAMFPFVEQLRETYRGKVSFAFRYFPLPSHLNSMNAALAVEAASQQGKLEPMFKKMFTTQTQWGEKRDTQATLFRGYAKEIGLDLTKYDAAVANPATKARIQKDIADGRAAGVQGTPTFFIDGKKIEADSAESFTSQIDAAIAAKR